MVRKILVLGLLAMSLAAPGAYAQTAPAAAAVDPASIQALKDMGAYLQTLKRFRVSTELTGERVLADGQKLQHAATADMDVERPNKLRAVMRSARSEREIIYDGKTVTLYTPAQKYYSTVEFSETIGELIDRLEERYGVAASVAGSLPLGHAGRAARQDRVGDECRPGFHRRRSLRPLRVSPGQDRLADLDHRRGQAAAAQGRDHQSRRRSASAVGLADRLESEADLQGLGLQVHAAQGRDQDRDRSAKDQVEERQHEEIIRQVACGLAGRPRSGQLCDGLLR